MTDTPELMNCPFCGADALYEPDGDHHGMYFTLGCPDRNCAAYHAFYTEPHEGLPKVVAAWNRRPVPTKMAPVQGWPQGIPWDLHLQAYAVYSKKYGEQQALIEGWCRGGFGTSELDEFIPGWRDKVTEIGTLRKEVAMLRGLLNWSTQ